MKNPLHSLSSSRWPLSCWRAHIRRQLCEVPSIPIPEPTPWPDLTNLKLGTKTCGIDGAGAPGSEKAKLNDLKNRFRLPSRQFQPITFDNLLALKQGHVQGSKIVGFPGSADPNNQRAVTVEGFVQLVFVGGWPHGRQLTIVRAIDV